MAINAASKDSKERRQNQLIKSVINMPLSKTPDGNNNKLWCAKCFVGGLVLHDEFQ